MGASGVLIQADTPQTKSLTIRVSNVNRLLGAGFTKVKVYKTSTTIEGNLTAGPRGPTPDPSTYVEVTTPETRIALVSNNSEYIFTDPNGTDDEWYAITYLKSDGTESQFGTPTQGTADPALDLFSVDTLKNVFLFGIDLTNDAGEPYPDALFQFYIRSAVAFVESKLDIVLTPTRYVDERHDFYKRDYEKYVFTKLDHVPVISVEECRLVLPTNVNVISYNPNSFNVDFNSGFLEIVPGSGQITLGQTGAFLPLVFGGQDYLPNALRVTYTAGFERCEIPGDLAEVVGMLASFGPLGIAGDLLVGAGIASTSLSIDGLSQSINTTSSATNSGYGARLVQYQKQLKDMWKALYQRYHPMNLVVA
jgi:hypothetical protein